MKSYKLVLGQRVKVHVLEAEVGILHVIIDCLYIFKVEDGEGMWWSLNTVSYQEFFEE